MFKLKKTVFLAALLVAASRVWAAEDDDEALNLAPVKKGADQVEVATPTAVPTVAAAVPTAVPTPKPKPKPKPAVTRLLTDVNVAQTADGIKVSVQGAGAFIGSAIPLKSPDRLLIKLTGVTLGAGVPRSQEIGLGSALKVRAGQLGPGSVQVVVDLSEAVAYRIEPSESDVFAVTLMTGGKTVAPPPVARLNAEVPKVNLMLFDLNVLYQDRQFDRFPCANFIYNAGDAFPLKREFISTFVFHDGYGAFVGNVRLVDPKGGVLAQTEQPFAFNLFNKLTDFQVELPWKVEFKEKGWYTLYLALNGVDVLQHRFYVGHNTDQP